MIGLVAAPAAAALASKLPAEVLAGEPISIVRLMQPEQTVFNLRAAALAELGRWHARAVDRVMFDALTEDRPRPGSLADKPGPALVDRRRYMKGDALWA